MRYRLAFVLLVSTAFTPALAADYKANSRIDAVTVFPSGAEVTRMAEQQLAAGEHTLVFENLPGDLMPETIRVEGTSSGEIEIGSVNSKVASVSTSDTGAIRLQFETRLEVLNDERTILDQTISDAEYQKSLMQQLASGAFTCAQQGRRRHQGVRSARAWQPSRSGRRQVASAVENHSQLAHAPAGHRQGGDGHSSEDFGTCATRGDAHHGDRASFGARCNGGNHQGQVSYRPGRMAADL